LIKHLKTQIGNDNRITLFLPDIPPGEVEILIIRQEQAVNKQDISMLPKHKLGRVLTSLSREDIYTDER
jgi:hypothetical protein